MSSWERALVTLGGDGHTISTSWTDTVSGQPTTVDAATVLDAPWWETTTSQLAEFLTGGTADSVNNLARRLTSVLLPRPIRSRFDQVEREIGNGPVLGIGIHVAPGAPRELWGLPWELLWLDGRYLLADPKRTVERIIDPDAHRPTQVEAGNQIRILVVEGSRSAPGAKTLAPSSAHSNLHLHLGDIDAAHLLQPLANPTLAELAEHIERLVDDGNAIDLLVFDGHGDPHGLWLQGPDGPHLAGPDELADAIADQVHIAMLVSCGAGLSLRWEGVSERLARAGTTVIACQTALEQRIGSDLVSTVASTLRAGKTLGDALIAGRHDLGAGALNVAGHSRMCLWQPTPDSLRLRIAATVKRVGADPIHETVRSAEVYEMARSALADLTLAATDLVYLVAQDDEDGRRILRALQSAHRSLDDTLRTTADMHRSADQPLARQLDPGAGFLAGKPSAPSKRPDRFRGEGGGGKILYSQPDPFEGRLARLRSSLAAWNQVRTAAGIADDGGITEAGTELLRRGRETADAIRLAVNGPDAPGAPGKP